MPGVLDDLRHAFRILRKNPAFAFTAILTLALGIGANSAIFNVVNALLLSSLPVPHPERLLLISTLDSKNGEHGFSIPAFEALQRRADSFSGMFAWLGGGMENLEINGVLTAGAADEIAGDYYQTLGIQPAAGRWITRSDKERVALLGYDTWQRFYHGDTGAIGKTILIDANPYTIVGIHPQSFHGLIREVEAQATVPVTSGPFSAKTLSDRSRAYYTVIGRLRDGVDPAQARAQIEAIWPSIREDTAPGENPQRDAFLSRRIQVMPAASGISYLRQRFTQPLYVLSAIVGVLLLLACVNLANVSLARAHARAAEYNIRAALGASRWRLAQTSLAESILLAILGAIPGIAFASWASRHLADFMWTGYGPLMLSLAPDFRMLLFTTAIAAAAAILFGLVPAWRAGRASTPASGSRIAGHLGLTPRILVTVQIALSFAIVCSAMLFSRSLINLMSRDPGFAADKLLIAQLFPRSTYTGLDKPAYYRQLLRSLNEIPGVARASISNERPINGFTRKEALQPSGVSASLAYVTPGYFETMEIPVLHGRDFDLNDGEDHPKVAVISAALAHLLGDNAIGLRVKIGNEKGEFEIVGVVSNAVHDPRTPDVPAIYADILQNPYYLGYSSAIIRTPGDPALLSRALREKIESLGRESSTIETVRAEVNRTLISERILALLAGFFGALALLLAAVGLYGLLSYTVSRRTAEIGIRVALGATRARIARLILKEVALLVALGLAVGLAIAVAGAKTISVLLHGLSAEDPSTLAMAAGALIGIALLASLIPSSRAAAIDPAVALRNE